jgi:DNA-binding LacI/PurR family transcriptional regulator
VAGLQAEAGAWTPAASVEFVAGANPKELSAAVAAALGRSPEARPTAVIALDADSTNAVLEQGSRLGLSIPHDLTLVTRASEHGDAKPLPSPVCVTTPLADLVGAAVEALSAAAEWRLSTAAKPRTIRVRRRSDPWKLEQLATPRSA